MSRALELRQQRSRLADEAAKLIPANNARMSAEARFKFDRIMGETDELKKQIDALESDEAAGRHGRLENELRQTSRPREANLNGYDEARELQSEREHQRAFGNFLRFGLHPTSRSRGVSAEDREILLDRNRETRDMGALGAGASGAYLVPAGFVRQVDVALKFAGDMLQAGTIMQTETGNPLPWPNENDTTISGEQVSENTQVSSQDVTVGSITFNAWKYSTKLVKVSIELIQDSAFDMTTFLANTFGARLGRILNNKFTLGVGTTEPNGIVTAAAAGPTATGAAANTGGSDSNTNTIGSTDLVELEHSVDRAYRRGASFMMSDTALKGIKEVLDKYGRPIWAPGLTAGTPDTILGYPYFLNNDMAVPAASAKSVLFGQLQKYMIREVKSLAVLRLEERFADYGQIGFIGFARYDGNLLDAGTHPVKYLIQHS